MSRFIRLGFGGIILNVFLAFLPVIIAFIRNNNNKFRILIYQGLAAVVNLLIGIFLNILPSFLIFRIIRNVWDVIFGIIWIYMIVCSVTDKDISRP